MPDQDLNAGNLGDRVKHAVLLHVLELVLKWPDLLYSETHAGDGLYPEGARNQHIPLLRAAVQSNPSDSSGSAAASAYLKQLRSWWASDEMQGYPGSALLAQRFLHGASAEYAMRGTEYCLDSHARLCASVSDARCTFKHDSFEDHLAWLTEAESPVLLVDPFNYIRTATGPSTLAGGRLGLPALTQILDHCAMKAAAVVMIWSCNCRTSPSSLTDLRNDINSWTSNHPATVSRQFRCGSYGISTVGIGTGSNAVRSLPSQSQWEKSWLAAALGNKVVVS